MGDSTRISVQACMLPTPIQCPAPLGMVQGGPGGLWSHLALAAPYFQPSHWTSRPAAQESADTTLMPPPSNK